MGTVNSPTPLFRVRMMTTPVKHSVMPSTWGCRWGKGPGAWHSGLKKLREIYTQMLHGAGIFTYIWVIYGVNVGKYSVHREFGIEQQSAIEHGIYRNSTINPSYP